MRIDAISIGIDPPREVNVIVEVPVGGEPIKYEMDKEAGTLVVDRFLYTAMRYPGNYGFIPHTLSNDGDPCDVPPHRRGNRMEARRRPPCEETRGQRRAPFPAGKQILDPHS